MSNPAIVELPDRVRDRDIFRDYENRLFVVLGYVQPLDRVLSYLKYVPDDDGTWTAGGVRYRRAFWGSVESTVEGMDILPKNYIIEDSHFRTQLIEPPRDIIREYFSPEQRLIEILESPGDSLEDTVKRAAETLHDELEIPLSALGIAGSILWKGHDVVHSDINMNIYGFSHARTLSDNLERVEKLCDWARLRNLREWNHAIERVSNRIPSLKQTDLKALFSRRRALCIDDRCIGITPVLYPEEAPIHHGSESYVTQAEEPMTFNMTIENAEYGMFHPAVYGIFPITYGGGTISRMMVYDGAFGGLFVEGDSVEVSGTLQRVTTANGEDEFYQVLVGTKTGPGREFIRFV